MQSVSNTIGQLFYVVSNGSVGPPYQATVTYSGTGTLVASGCVEAEYKGTDPNYPLDSVSAGYSYSAGGYMDSGTAAPANANLLVFAGGINSADTLPYPGSGFSSVQSNGATGSITEQMIVSGNNTLQRATAYLGTAALPCPATPTGNWLMQMAVFRDASWTVSGGWTPVRPGQVLDASQFPGSDIGAQVNAAYAACPSYGCKIVIPSQSACYNFSTQIAFTTLGKIINLEGAASGPVCLNWIGSSSGTAMQVGWGGNYLVNGHPGVISNFTLCYASCNSSGASSSTVGLYIGDQTTQGVTIRNMAFQGWGTAIQCGSSFDVHIEEDVIIDNGIGIANGSSNGGASPLWISHGLIDANSNENILLSRGDNYMDETDFQIASTTGLGVVITGNYVTFTSTGVHYEMIGSILGATGAFISSTGTGDQITIHGGIMIADGVSSAQTIPEFIQTNGEWLDIEGTAYSIGNKQSLTQMVKATGGGVARICMRIGGSPPTWLGGAGASSTALKVCSTQTTNSGIGIEQFQHYDIQPDIQNIGSLITCAANNEGAHSVANNCSAGCSAGGTCTAGGSTHCEVYCNSSAWIETGR